MAFNRDNFIAGLQSSAAIAALPQVEQDQYWMRCAIELAEQAAELGEVPVAAIVVKDQALVGLGFNRPICDHNACAHAEVLALADAGKNTQNYRLPVCDIYVTIEPCMMCSGALIHARIQRLIYGASEPKAGAVDSHPLLDQAFLNHRIEVVSGVLADECSEQISRFFRLRRQQQRRQKARP